MSQSLWFCSQGAYTFLFWKCVPCPAHISSLLKFGEEYKSWRFLLRCFRVLTTIHLLHRPVREHPQPIPFPWHERQPSLQWRRVTDKHENQGSHDGEYLGWVFRGNDTVLFGILAASGRDLLLPFSGSYETFVPFKRQLFSSSCLLVKSFISVVNCFLSASPFTRFQSFSRGRCRNSGILTIRVVVKQGLRTRETDVPAEVLFSCHFIVGWHRNRNTAVRQNWTSLLVILFCFSNFTSHTFTLRPIEMIVIKGDYQP